MSFYNSSYAMKHHFSINWAKAAGIDARRLGSSLGLISPTWLKKKKKDIRIGDASKHPRSSLHVLRQFVALALLLVQ